MRSLACILLCLVGFQVVSPHWAAGCMAHPEARNATGYARVMEEWAIIEPGSTGLVGRWRFEEGSGNTANDDSGNGRHANLFNGPEWGNGVVGGGLQFDGVDDFAAVPNHSSLHLNTMTIAFWMRKDATPAAWARLVAKGSGSGENYGVLAAPNSNKKLRFQFRRTDGTTMTLNTLSDVEVGRWYHVTCTYILCLSLNCPAK